MCLAELLLLLKAFCFDLIELSLSAGVERLLRLRLHGGRFATIAQKEAGLSGTTFCTFGLVHRLLLEQRGLRVIPALLLDSQQQLIGLVTL